MRKDYIDILKGVLIIFVVIGHTIKHNDIQTAIFWFHMPAFFMVSGYLYKPRPFDIQWLRKTTIAYILPYFSYCVAIFAIFHFEGIAKYLIRISVGGALNTTSYTYPFWFINALFICLLEFAFIKNKLPQKTDSACVLLLFILAFTLSKFIKIHMLPWAFAQAQIGLFFLYLGNYYQHIENHISTKCFRIAVIAAAILVPIYFAQDFWQIGFNLKTMQLNNLVSSIVIPSTITILLLGISKFFTRFQLVKIAFCNIGQASMTIFFTHATFLHLSMSFHPISRIAISLVGGFALHLLFKLNKFTTLAFLGKSSTAKQ